MNCTIIFASSETERALEAQGERFRNNVCEYLRGIQSDVLAYTEELKESFTSMTSELDMETFFIYENMQRIGNQLSTVLSEEHLPETNNLVSNINESVRIIQTFLYNSEPHNISHFPLYIRYIVTHQYSDTFKNG
ncbi:uncharacterized protein LOC108627976 isoform X2 [Ceratina calcarata]|uniref:Uncharacterized protein LOC108627976 isoform X2 n=1 Tax=Ceratina calcarata TaxID=156304 RepID=A0AAJ7WDZ4_9HYME|nr:uncharacterized protein LOC108627976 isoform X2 [Ceratina calcarata]